MLDGVIPAPRCAEDVFCRRAFSVLSYVVLSGRYERGPPATAVNVIRLVFGQRARHQSSGEDWT